MRNWLLAIPLGIMAAALAAIEAPAQNVNYSKSGSRPTQGTQGYTGAAAPQTSSQMIYQPPPVGVQYAYSDSPYSSTSSGFVVDNLVNQQANILQQQAEQAKIDTRKQLFDQRRYEQMMTPTYEETRQSALATQYSQARSNPPLQLIWSGSAPNTLVDLIRQTQAATGILGPTIPLPPDLLPHLNFNSGTRSTGGTAMIQNGGSKLEWPLALSRDDFAGSRRIIEKAIDEAVSGVQTGSPGANKAIGKAQSELSNLREGLRANVRKESGQDYVDAVGFLSSVGAAVDALKQPETARLMASPIRASTVADLVNQMTAKGVRFTACAKGDENYYNALYSALNAYDLGLQRMTGGFRPPEEETKKNRFE